MKITANDYSVTSSDSSITLNNITRISVGNNNRYCAFQGVAPLYALKRIASHTPFDQNTCDGEQRNINKGRARKVHEYAKNDINAFLPAIICSISPAAVKELFGDMGQFASEIQVDAELIRDELHILDGGHRLHHADNHAYGRLETMVPFLFVADDGNVAVRRKIFMDTNGHVKGVDRNLTNTLYIVENADDELKVSAPALWITKHLIADQNLFFYGNTSCTGESRDGLIKLQQVLAVIEDAERSLGWFKSLDVDTKLQVSTIIFKRISTSWKRSLHYWFMTPKTRPAMERKPPIIHTRACLSVIFSSLLHLYKRGNSDLELFDSHLAAVKSYTARNIKNIKSSFADIRMTFQRIRDYIDGLDYV